ncbi:leucine-rich repeat-containing protein 59 [Ceratitis capitata]|uniref:Leucine-rich repeat-containing protein 59 n=2 Tax=Ceratitis capitata TaxID=7213 RepID=W8BS84_CERCA|nr:leucine-rich repeat-containing protein 59 [Ceratitis capitata]XP_020717751.1 leucine-rich repeat-containing protein 59 [Ceratitis capitata]
MPKAEKVKVNVKERVEDNVCDLSLSGINEVPVREIASFKRVTVLDLSSNCISLLSKNFVTLTRLVKLDLSKNQIRFLPDDFGLLRNLRHLDLYDNKLEHLPMSFADLASLRYLDLKGNPLTPALANVVGFCLTQKECQDSAKNTVKFLRRIRVEVEKVKEQYQLEALTEHNIRTEDIAAEEKPPENAKSKKSAAKKAKSKAKKSNTNNNNNSNDINSEMKLAQTNANNKVTKSKKNANTSAKKSMSKSSTALTTVFTFFLLLAINVLVIYMIMFKNPEIADKLVEFIPQQYRDWILTNTEIFRLRVTDWISEFRTTPTEH